VGDFACGASEFKLGLGSMLIHDLVVPLRCWGATLTHYYKVILQTIIKEYSIIY
jgi:hypothetical protein